MKWHHFDHEDQSTWPTELGEYAFMISGDSEIDGPHVFYEYDDYRTFGSVTKIDKDPDDPDIRISCDHDEEIFTIFAWYGPLNIPTYNGE